MDDLQSTLESLLQNPKELEQLAQTAAAMLQGDTNEEQTDKSDQPFFDLQTLMKSLNGESNDRSQQLLTALRPYLSDNRRARLDRASKIARLSKFAEFAFGSELFDG